MCEGVRLTSFLGSYYRISKQHDIDALDKEGHSALCMAAQNRCMDVLRLLLESGVNIDKQQADVRPSESTSPFRRGSH
jgi:ankyrin repeat protein